MHDLHNKRDLKPIWKEVVELPGSFLKELLSDLKLLPSKSKEKSMGLKNFFFRLFNTKGDWIVKAYVFFVLIILPFVLNHFFGPLFDAVFSPSPD